MKFVHILVEGQTEETFVTQILQPYFWLQDIHLEPKLVTTKRLNYRADFKGGIVSYGKVKFDIQQLLKDTHVSLVTTMIDFYGLAGKDFPEWDKLKGNPYEKVQEFEKAIDADIGQQRFRSFFMLHEFEALLLSQPASVVSAMTDNDEKKQQKILAQLEKMIEHISPEEINLENPPSYRLTALMPQYKKGLYAVIILTGIPLTILRAKCPHFDAWMLMLESLGS